MVLLHPAPPSDPLPDPPFFSARSSIPQHSRRRLSHQQAPTPSILQSRAPYFDGRSYRTPAGLGIVGSPVNRRVNRPRMVFTMYNIMITHINKSLRKLQMLQINGHSAGARYSSSGCSGSLSLVLFGADVGRCGSVFGRGVGRARNFWYGGRWCFAIGLHG